MRILIVSIKTKQIAEYVVDPVLEALDLDGRLTMLAYAAQESHMGAYIHQINGPALGLWQVEPATHDDVWRYLLRKDDPNETRIKRMEWIKYLIPTTSKYFYACTKKYWLEEKLYNQYHDRLIYDLRYCCAIARLKLYMIPKPLPAEDDIEGMAEYWKAYYNSSQGKGTEEQFIIKYNKYVKPYITEK